MKVENMQGRSGPVKNQFNILDDEGNRYFQSYGSIIAKILPSGHVELDSQYWDYSTTTGKYRNAFLGESKADTARKIASGEYVLTDLNSRSVP